LLPQAESLQAECDFTKEQVTAMKGELVALIKRINLSSIRESSEVNYCKKKLRPGKGVFTTLIPDCWYWGIKTWENERL